MHWSRCECEWWRCRCFVERASRWRSSSNPALKRPHNMQWRHTRLTSSVNIRHFRSHPVCARRTEGEAGVTAFRRWQAVTVFPLVSKETRKNAILFDFGSSWCWRSCDNETNLHRDGINCLHKLRQQSASSSCNRHWLLSREAHKHANYCPSRLKPGKSIWNEFFPISKWWPHLEIIIFLIFFRLHVLSYWIKIQNLSKVNPKQIDQLIVWWRHGEWYYTMEYGIIAT